jgi:hypothetical protein
MRLEESVALLTWERSENTRCWLHNGQVHFLNCCKPLAAIRNCAEVDANGISDGYLSFLIMKYVKRFLTYSIPRLYMLIEGISYHIPFKWLTD